WADFDPVRLGLATFRRLVSRDVYSGPAVWTPTGDALLFHEVMPGKFHDEVKRQMLRGGEPQVLVSNLRHFDSYALTSDGRWLLYSEFGAVRRTPSSGGPETPLFEVAGMGIVKCAGRASNVCIESRGQGSDAPHLSVFDPAVGHPRPFASLPLVDGTS